MFIAAYIVALDFTFDTVADLFPRVSVSPNNFRNAHVSEAHSFKTSFKSVHGRSLFVVVFVVVVVCGVALLLVVEMLTLRVSPTFHFLLRH